MKQFFKKSFIGISLIMLSTSLNAQDFQVWQRKDSLRKIIAHREGEDKLNAYQKLTGIYFPESGGDSLKLDTLIILYDEMKLEARKQGNMKTECLAMANQLFAYNNNHMYDEIFKFSPEYLDFFRKNEMWKFYYNIYRLLLDVYQKQGDYEKVIREANKLYEEAKTRDHNIGVGMALYAISNAYGYMSRNEEEEKYMRQSIEALKKDGGSLHLVASGYFYLCQSLLSQERYDDVRKELVEFEKINYLYEKESQMKQQTSWNNLWRIAIKLYIQIGDYSKAEAYCKKLEENNPTLDYNGQITLAKARAEIYKFHKQYKEALDMIDLSIELMHGEPTETNNQRKEKAEILAKMGKAEETYRLFLEILDANDSIRNFEFNGKLDELRTQYEVDKLTIQKERNRNYMLMALGGCLLLLVVLSIYVLYSSRLKAKNRSLYQQIQERIQKEKTAEEAIIRIPETELSREMQLFRTLSERMQKDKLFTNPDISRKSLADLVGTNEMYLADAIREGSGETFSEYITHLRLNYALELLNNQPELTLDAIAIDSGHGSYSPFYRSFGKTFGMSPSEYRKLSSVKNIQK